MTHWWSAIFLGAMTTVLFVVYLVAYMIAQEGNRIAVPANVEHDNYPAKTRIISFTYRLPNGRLRRASKVLSENMKTHYQFVSGFQRDMAITVYVSPFNALDVSLENTTAKSLNFANRIRHAHIGFAFFTIISIIIAVVNK